MLTPEQTRLRLYDSELRELRVENERLKEKVKKMATGMKEIALEYAKQLPYTQRQQLIAMANEIEA